MGNPYRASSRSGVRWLRGALAGAGVLVALAVLASLWLLRDPRPRFADRRSTLAHVEEEEVSRTPGHASRAVRLRAESGLGVELLVRWPDPEVAGAGAVERGRPLFVILGGYRTGHRAAALMEDTGGAVVAALGYPYDGPHDLKGLEVVRWVPAIRRALLDTPPAVQLALDYLLARDDVDAERVELVGVSLGTGFVTIAAALDERVSRLWLIHGAGRPFRLLEHNLRRSLPQASLRTPVAAVANVLAAGPRLAPERWIPEVSPRPVFMINAIEDERMPRVAVETLYASAREPKEHIWLPGPHVQTNREEVIQDLVELVLTRAAAQPPVPAGDGFRDDAEREGA